MRYPNADTGSLVNFYLASQQIAAEREAAREQAIDPLAALAHEQWSGWMRYLFSRCTPHADGSVTIPPALVERWQRQMITPYADLPPDEQESDRTEARKVLALLESEGVC